MLLYERERFFDFVQAAVRAGFEFHGPALTLQRCRTLLRHGRGIWTDLLEAGEDITPTVLAHYLKSVYHAACTVAGLNGNPLAERRLLLDFPALAEKAEHPQMAGALAELLGASRLEEGIPPGWLDSWQASFTAAAASGRAETRIHPVRLNYYRKAFEALPGITALWSLIHTWTLSVLVLPPSEWTAWRAAMVSLELTGPAFAEKVQSLDKFLDDIEILLDEIATANGLETSTTI